METEISYVDVSDINFSCIDPIPVISVANHDTCFVFAKVSEAFAPEIKTIVNGQMSVCFADEHQFVVEYANVCVQNIGPPILEMTNYTAAQNLLTEFESINVIDRPDQYTSERYACLVKWNTNTSVFQVLKFC